VNDENNNNTNSNKRSSKGEDKVAWDGYALPTIEISPPKHDGRSSATYELPQKNFACWRFSHVPVLLSRAH